MDVFVLSEGTASDKMILSIHRSISDAKNKVESLIIYKPVDYWRGNDEEQIINYYSGKYFTIKRYKVE